MTDDSTKSDFRPIGGDEGGGENAGRQRGPTMTEVALEAKVSQTTVSLVLNHVKGARFTTETRRRVFDAAERLNYRTTRRRNASSGSTQGAIAFIVDEMSTDPWMALAMDGIREKTWEHNITAHALATGGNCEVEQAVLRQLASPQFAGLIYGTINTRRVQRPPLPRGIPTVLLNCYVADHSLPSIVPAEALGGQIATRRLIAAGHRRIGYINGEPWMDASRDRLKGYRRALAVADIAFDPELVRNGNWEPSSGYEHARALFALEQPPTAIFCGNDLMALGCYEALKEMGLSIPRDVAVVGYDDREIARYIHPPLSTVVLPHYEMGLAAAECLIDLIARPPGAAAQIKVEGRLVDRESI